MIKSLKVENFKSIKEIKLNCKKVNVFIGEPNTGKSNILEVLGLLAHLYYDNLDGFVRHERMSNLFYNEEIDNIMRISFDQKNFEIKFDKFQFIGTYDDKKLFEYEERRRSSSTHGDFQLFKFYRFIRRTDFPNKDISSLHPPDGDNLFAIVYTNKKIKNIFKDIFAHFGYKIVFKPQEYKLEVQKEIEDIIISLPYSLVSDTLQRIIFFLTAIYSNKNSIIAFEEPEAHAFPYYTKILAENIALDESENQYFISTHNPHFLLSILEKSKSEDIAIFLTYLKNYQTKVKLLGKKEIKDILDKGIDLFIDIERLLKGRK